MPKTAKSKQSTGVHAPKFGYGVVAGAVVGTGAILLAPATATYILVALVVLAAYVFFTARRRNLGNKWSPSAFSPAPALGALVVGVMSVAGVQFLGMSLAWHPQGTIQKTVQNITTNGPVADANTSSTALTVKPNDILNYSITIKNVAPPAGNQYNDMAYTVMTDTLPAGIVLVADPAKRTITENIGTILPGKSVTKNYQVKVTSATNGAVIENKACFTGDSVVKDKPQKGCDVAIVKVQVPPTPPPNPPTPTPTPPTPNPPTPTPPTPTPPNPPTPTPNPPTPTPTPPTPNPPTPTPTPTPPTPTPTPPTETPPTPPPSTPTATPPSELPNVGPRSIIIVALIAVATGYLVSALYGFKRNKAVRFQ